MQTRVQGGNYVQHKMRENRVAALGSLAETRRSGVGADVFIGLVRGMRLAARRYDDSKLMAGCVFSVSAVSHGVGSVQIVLLPFGLSSKGVHVCYYRRDSIP